MRFFVLLCFGFIVFVCFGGDDISLFKADVASILS